MTMCVSCRNYSGFFRENRLLKNAAVFEKNVLRVNHFFREFSKMRYGHIFYYHPVYSVLSIIYTPSCISYLTGLRNTPGSASRLLVNEVIPILIGPSKNPTMYDRDGEPGRVCTVRRLQTRTQQTGVFWE